MNWKYYRPKFEYGEEINPLASGWFGHTFFAYDFVRNFKPKKIVELGTHYGHSFFSFCQAAKDGDQDAGLFAVDSWGGDKHAGFYEESIYEAVKLVEKSYYLNQKINLLRKTFDEALHDFEDGTIDLLHIDGVHTYEAAKHDFESWISKVRADGVVFIHDTFINRDDFGVYRFWEELKKEYKTMEFYHSYGLGILFKDEKNYDKYLNLEKDWQMRYSSFADDVRNNEMLKMIEAISQKNIDIQKEEVVRNKEQIIRQKDQEIQQKIGIIASKENEIRNKKEEIRIMKSSKFWKMREKYLKAKGGIFKADRSEKRNHE